VLKHRQKAILCIGNNPVSLNLRCSLLKAHGWNGISSGSGHEGVIRFGRETVDAVVIDLDDDGAEAALIAGELKRLRPEVPIVIVVTDEKELANGATQQASGVVMKSQEGHMLVEVLQKLFPAQ
jgi:CheY-like chemotaxis protein